MTPKELTDAWREANTIYGFDPITGDFEAEKLLHNLPQESDGIANNIAGLERVRDVCPDFFAAYNYDWAFDASVYRRAIEANLQTRALQLLSMLHRNPNTPDGFQYENVAVRYTFEAGTDPCTPFHAPHQGLHFIVTPFSFLEFVLLLTRAFIDSIAGEDSLWSRLNTAPQLSKHTVSPYLRQAILRALTTDAFHSSFTGPSPVETVKSASNWFAEAHETGLVDETLEVSISYSLTDFALAHELGHVLHGHKGLAREPDLRLEKEQDADVMGFALYNSSWGWRDEVLDPCPLNQGPRILLGPLFFHLFIKWQLALRQGLAYRRLISKAHSANVRADQLKLEASESEARTSVAFKQVAAYEAEIRNRGAVFTEEDTNLFAALARLGGQFALHIFSVVKNIPEEDYEIARAAGEIGF